MFSITKPEALYQADYVLWLDDTIHQLRCHNFAELDIEHLIEELEDLGNERRNAVVSLLDQIIRHLLLLEYWQAARDYNATHWRGEIYNFRVQLGDRLTKTLYNYLLSELDKIYRRSLKGVQIKTENAVDFPAVCPYSIEQLLDSDWLPD
ncbi:MAG: DUF29 domain-containing protein [Synechocystis sp.]|nr:DUF29 domain-containing protein [Synechocystis sp.]